MGGFDVRSALVDNQRSQRVLGPISRSGLVLRHLLLAFRVLGMPVAMNHIFPLGVWEWVDLSRGVKKGLSGRNGRGRLSVDSVDGSVAKTHAR